LPETDLELLKQAARQAGDIALRFWKGQNEIWHKGPDDPVSEADFAVDTFLRETLLAARPDYGWLSEETEDSEARLEKRAVFVVDPIDGTRAFIGGQLTWAHSLSVVRDGLPVAAVVYLPAREKLYTASSGGGAALNDVPLSVSGHDSPDGARVLASRPTYDSGHWPAGVPQFDRNFRPSLAYRLSLVGEGRFDAMLTFRDSWEWDIAAGALIAAEAGARTTDAKGHPLKFNNPRPATSGVVAANPELHSGIMDRLATT
jgi:myo-inositol-1(or 4)-monophosphatase